MDPSRDLERLLPFFLHAGREENPAGLRELPPGPGACREPREPGPAPALSHSPSCHCSQYIIIIMCK